QLPYSLVSRDIERAELPLAKHWDIAVLPFGALGAGLLSGKYGRGESGRLGQPKVTEQQQRIIDEVATIAQEVGRTPSQVALNWVRQQQQRAVIVPILGARNETQLQDNLQCLEWTLSAEQLQRLDEVSRIDYGFQRSIEASPYVFGTTWD